MIWDDFVSKFFSTEDSVLKEISLSNGPEGRKPFPGYLRLLAKVLTDITIYDHNYLVIKHLSDPDFAFRFALYKVITDVLSQNIASVYDVHQLKKGQKLSFGKAVVIFDGIRSEKFPDEDNPVDVLDILVKKKASDANASVRRSFYLSKAPVFNKSFDGAEVSSNEVFNREYHQENSLGIDETTVFGKLHLLKTRQQESVIFVSSVPHYAALCQNLFLEQHRLLDGVSIAKSDFGGSIKSIEGPSEKPQIILASGVDSAVNVVNKNESNFHVAAVYIDGSFANQTDLMVADLEELKDLGVQIFYFYPENEAVDAAKLADLDFDFVDFTRTLLSSPSLQNYNNVDPILSNIASRCVSNVECRSQEIIDCYDVLSSYSKTIDTLPSVAQNCFRSFETNFFSELWRCQPIDKVPEKESLLDAFSRRVEEVKKAKNYIPDGNFVKDMVSALEKLLVLYGRPRCHKQIMIQCFLTQSAGKSVLLVIQRGFDSAKALAFYSNWMMDNLVRNVSFFVCTDREFSDLPRTQHFDEIVVVGWLGRDNMREILLSGKAPKFTILTHQCELVWAIYGIGEINRCDYPKINELDMEIDDPIGRPLPIDFAPTKDLSNAQEDFTEVYERYKSSKYQRFAEGASPKEKMVLALPVSFNNDTSGCFTPNSVFIRINHVIDQNGEIEEISPDLLKIGDVIVTSSSLTDVVKEVADSFLAQEGQSNARAIATSWKNVFKMRREMGDDEVFTLLQMSGMKHTKITVRQWMYQESYICPMKIEDLALIADVFHDPILKEDYKTVFEKASIVKSAHIRAGHFLSAELFNNVTFQNGVKKLGESSKFLMEPQKITIPKYGEVEVISVVDIGQQGLYPYSNANRFRKEAE